MNGVVDLFHLVTDFCPNAGSVRFLRAFGVLNGTFIPGLWQLGNSWNAIQSFGSKIQQA
jgi:hypothetical protein